jgi:hypothetical protein
MKHQRVRAAAVAAATVGLALGATVTTAGGAQAAARPNVAGNWSCQSLGSITGPDDTVLGQPCTGAGLDAGWFALTGGGDEYFCQSFSAVRRLGIYYAVTGTGCEAG